MIWCVSASERENQGVSGKAAAAELFAEVHNHHNTFIQTHYSIAEGFKGKGCNKTV
jgi:membrane carboxypeptidase/penicillin-binding protein PbpC